MKYYYIVEDDDKFDIKIADDDYEYVICKCAEDYYDNHDGRYDKWPLMFKLYDEEENELGRYTVELEFDPHFYVFP